MCWGSEEVNSGLEILFRLAKFIPLGRKTFSDGIYYNRLEEVLGRRRWLRIAELSHVAVADRIL